MLVNILAVGDVVGNCGVEFLSEKLRTVRKEQNIAFAVVNGENASMSGLTPRQADDILAAGADVITLGNHSFGRQNILPYLDECPYILRPANLSPLSAGRGWGIFDSAFGPVCVVSLIGRCGMDFGADNPFFAADDILRRRENAAVTLVDFHAEATSEKAAMAFHLDGRVSAVWGTHTHVQTSDAGIFPKGTGFITDLGMTGPAVSVLGVRPEQSVARFLGDPARRPYEPADGPCKLEAAVFSVDSATGLCQSAKAIRIPS